MGQADFTFIQKKMNIVHLYRYMQSLVETQSSNKKSDLKFTFNGLPNAIFANVNSKLTI